MILRAISRKEIYSPYDLSLMFQVGENTILDWMNQGQLRFVQVPGEHCRVSQPDLEAFLIRNGYDFKGLMAEKNQKFKTLVVEDDDDLLETIGELLTDETRLEVRKESNGLNAYFQIASWHPDLILLDFVMPGMNGFEICKKIRSNPNTRDIPVLAVTCLSNFENRKAVFESGVSDFLEKPFYSEGLLGKVRSLLGLIPAVDSPLKKS